MLYWHVTVTTHYFVHTLVCFTKGRVISSYFSFLETPLRGPSAAVLRCGFLTQKTLGTTARLTAVSFGFHLIALIRLFQQGSKGYFISLQHLYQRTSGKGRPKPTRGNEGAMIFLIYPSAPWCYGVFPPPNQFLYILACSYPGLELISEEIMNKNVLILMKTLSWQDQGVKRIPRRINIKKTC